jgi:hypothetical protein
MALQEVASVGLGAHPQLRPSWGKRYEPGHGSSHSQARTRLDIDECRALALSACDRSVRCSKGIGGTRSAPVLGGDATDCGERSCQPFAGAMRHSPYSCSE